jgi:hypothetical protein
MPCGRSLLSNRFTLQGFDGKAIFGQPAVDKCALKIGELCRKQPAIALDIISEREHLRVARDVHGRFSAPNDFGASTKKSPARPLFVSTPAPLLQPHRKAAWPRPIRIIVEAAQRIHNLVEGNRPLRPWRLPQAGHRLHRAGIGCPGREYGALFLPAQVRIVENVARMFEHRRGIEKMIKFEVHAPHRSLLFFSFQVHHE